MHVVLLPVPPQTHGDKSQQDEHHDSQNAAHDQVQETSGRAGGFLRVGAGRGDGVLAGRARRLTCCSRKKEHEEQLSYPLASKSNNTVPN